MSLCRLILIQLVLAVALSGCTWLQDPSGIRNLPMLPEDAGTASTADEYRLGAGDIVTVRVYDWRMNDARTAADDDLRLDKIRLDSSGTISLPILFVKPPDLFPSGRGVLLLRPSPASQRCDAGQQGEGNR